MPLQTRVLDRWPDGSVRWALLDWQGEGSLSSVYRERVASGIEPPFLRPAVRVESHPGKALVDTSHGSHW